METLKNVIFLFMLVIAVLIIIGYMFVYPILLPICALTFLALAINYQMNKEIIAKQKTKLEEKK